MTDNNSNTELKVIKTKKLEELCKRYNIISKQSKQLEMEKETVKKELLLQLKDFEKVQCKNWLVTYTLTAGRKGTEVTEEMVGTRYGVTPAYKTLKVVDFFVGVE